MSCEHDFVALITYTHMYMNATEVSYSELLIYEIAGTTNISFHYILFSLKVQFFNIKQINSYNKL